MDVRWPRCLSRASRTSTWSRTAFGSEDTAGSTKACSVSHEALRDHAQRAHLSGTDAAVFEAYRELIEQVASYAYDAEGPFDDHGRILVTSEALARVTRSA
ncbi:MAG: DUF1488 family protein [Methyloceanibacter sp.]